MTTHRSESACPSCGEVDQQGTRYNTERCLHAWHSFLERPDDDPAPIPTCNGRDCGGRPHE